MDNLAAYLSAYMMDWGDESLDAPENVQYFNSPESEGILELTHFEIGEDRFPNNQQSEGVKTKTVDGDKGTDPPPIME